MKKIFLIITIFLITFNFQSLTKADDIRDFQIEGMSIGDSLLDYFSKQEIKQNLMLDYYMNFPKDYRKIYRISEFKKNSRFKTYANVSIDFFENDKKFIIQTISGLIFIKNSEECYKKQNQIDEDLSKLFKNISRQINKDNHSFDKTGNSKTRAINYWFDNGDLITLICTDWSNAITNSYGWTDNLALEIKKKEYNNFLRDAYN